MNSRHQPQTHPTAHPIPALRVLFREFPMIQIHSSSLFHSFRARSNKICLCFQRLTNSSSLLKNKSSICTLFTKTHRGRGSYCLALQKIAGPSSFEGSLRFRTGHWSPIAETLSHRPVKCATVRQMTTTIKNTSTAKSSPSPASSRRSLMASLGGRGSFIIRQSCRSRNRHSPVCALFYQPFTICPFATGPTCFHWHSEMIRAGVAFAFLNFQLLTADCRLP